MKLKWIAVVFLLPLAVASCGQEPDTQEASRKAEAPVADIAAKHSDTVKVAFQNEYIRVLRFDIEPNESLPPHTGRHRVIYSLTDYELDWMEGGEALGRRTWNEGDVHVHDAAIHEARNTGDTIASFLVFERLDSPLPSAPMHEDGSELPAGARSLLTNADFQVLEIELKPGDRQELHLGGWRAIYSLSDYTIEWREGDEVEQKSWSAGDAHWHAPAQHAAANTGDAVARWLVVGFKN